MMRQRDSGSPVPAEGPAVLKALGRWRGPLLLLGAPGVGKSTLAFSLARALAAEGRACWCLSADPGSPLFGVPGAVCLGEWTDGAFRLRSLTALCTLDAARFRQPLVTAVSQLMADLPDHVSLLVDGPGVVRGVAAGELLAGLVQAADVRQIVRLQRAGAKPKLVNELAALSLPLLDVQAADAAQRPGVRARARHRTKLWDKWLGTGVEQKVELCRLAVIGTPPPAVPEAWIGRQIALLRQGRTLTMGEVLAYGSGDRLRLHLQASAEQGDALLVRDAQRDANDRLVSSPPFVNEPLAYSPPVAPEQGPQITGRVGSLDVTLVNGVFGDPLLHARLRQHRGSLLFDLGEGNRLPARVAHQVTNVFITHAHMDHISGFLWLLRSRMGETSVCRLYGPPGLAGNVQGFLNAFLWDRIGDHGPRFSVHELHADHSIQQFELQGGRAEMVSTGTSETADGVLLEGPDFRVRAVSLDHLYTRVLAFAYEPRQTMQVRKDQLQARQLPPGPWLGKLKRALQAGQRMLPIELPNGRREPAGDLADELILISPPKRLVYATDFADTPDNRERLIRLARHAHTLFCEASFRVRDAEQAKRTGHLTTQACAEIAEAANVARLVPFHFSQRYEHELAEVYAEIVAVSRKVVVPGSIEGIDGF